MIDIDMTEIIRMTAEGRVFAYNSLMSKTIAEIKRLAALGDSSITVRMVDVLTNDMRKEFEMEFVNKGFKISSNDYWLSIYWR
jgi:hypothetical protein